jgi:outer membrane protein
LRKSKARIFKTAVLVIGLAVVTPVTAKAENLADALADAYKNSGLIAQNRALLRAADEDVASIVSELRPIINWTADVTRNFGKTRTNGIRQPISNTTANIGVSLDLLLYDFGRTPLRIEAAKESVLATREGLRSVEQQVLFRAIQAYMNLRRNSQFVSLRENNLRLLQQELRAARDRFEVGEVTRTDVAQAEAALALARSGLATARGNLAQAVEEFRAAVGRSPGQLRAPQRLPALKSGAESAKGLALRNHPDALQVRHEVSSSELTVKAAAAAMKPTIGLTAGLRVGETITDSDNSRSGSVGVQMSGPIYQGGRLSSAKRRAMAVRDQNRARLLTTNLRLAQDVGNAYATLEAARASRAANQEAVRAARVAFRGVREEAKLGARTTLDVLDAEQNLLDARTNLISAEVDVYIAAYAVLGAIGQLTAKDLNLNVPTYDPAAYYNMVKTAPAEMSAQGRKLDRVLKALGKQ